MLEIFMLQLGVQYFLFSSSPREPRAMPAVLAFNGKRKSYVESENTGSRSQHLIKILSGVRRG